ncbi:facilitated trehalose transporter Tret1-like [Toxorhynchites rutilus septentrionalis]|uniref:facilitated trehalose transporter Tret1-like n=1 Tax=Toxorhynchites rutilus septentrionalis TaxID=329112 RepID=UPI002478AA46|nr:facilitated trehalose transporter Tret1-like [Toxorhynchites rutilus septentrionalis]
MAAKRDKRGLSQYRNEYLAAIAATFSLLATVAAAGWSSPAIPALKQDDSPVPITANQGSWIVSILSIGSLFGPIITGLAVDRYGPKRTLLLSVIPLAIGWVIIVFASNVHIIYAARFLHGISYGTAYSVTPIYLGEISSNAIRGSTGVLITVMAKFAFLLEYSIGPYVDFRSLAWISLTFPVIFFILFFWMPESPYYLLAHNRDKEALSTLRWLRRSDESSEQIEKEFTQMKALVQKTQHDESSLNNLFARSNRKSLGIILLLSCGMQLTGINAILGYAQTIFSKLEMELNAAELSIILASVQLIAVFIPTFFVDRAGRRPLLLLSTGGSLFALIACSVYFTFDAFDYPTETLSWVPFVSTLGFIVSFALGLATVPFAILSEIFPKSIKANANAVFAMVTSLVVFVVVKLFQVISDSAGTYVSFWIFSGCTACTGVLIHFFIPETRGKSFEEIQEIMTVESSSKEKTKCLPLLC